MQGGTIAGGGHLTVEAGSEILIEGGNAVDAAVAAAFAAFHAEPLLASAAGGGVFISGDNDRRCSVLSFSPTMPGRGVATRPELDFRSVWIDFGVTKQEFHVGRGAAAVPAGLLGLYEAHRRWGRLPIAAIVAPAVRICREGFIVNHAADRFIQILEPIWRLSDESAELYTTDGRRATMGDSLTNPKFADTLELLAREGPRPFHEGDIARRTIEAFGPDAGGLITAADLAGYEPMELEPLEVSAWGGTFLTPPPPTTGGTLVALALGVLSRLGLGREDYGSEKHLRAVIDAQLLTMAIRREIYGADGTIPLETAKALLTEEGLRDQMAQLGTIARDGRPTPPGHGSTTHVSVLDDDGGAAAVTVSNGEGCGYVIPGTGMHMNNFLGEDDINPTGFHMLPVGTPLPTMMSPTIFVRDGRPELVLGSGGSSRLRTAITQVALNRLGLDQPIAVSVRAPRVHLEEDAFHAETLTENRELLTKLAAPYEQRDLFPERSLYFGGVHTVARESDGSLVGYGDPRRAGAAETVTGM